MSFSYIRYDEKWRWESGMAFNDQGQYRWTPTARQVSYIEPKNVYVHIPCKKYASGYEKKLAIPFFFAFLLCGLGSLSYEHATWVRDGTSTEWKMLGNILIGIGLIPCWYTLKYFVLDFKYTKKTKGIKCDCGRHRGQLMGKPKN